MVQDIECAIQLQALDGKIGDLEREIGDLPKHIAKIEKTLESHERKLEADRAALAANQKERRQHEGEIQLQEQKVSKLRDQMLQAKTNEQYRAFQHEIEYCQQTVQQHEDRILELMLDSEKLEQNVATADASLKREREQVESEKTQVRARVAADQKQHGELAAQRKVIYVSLNPQMASLYERVRRKWGVMVVADGTDGRCSACHIGLRPQLFQDLKRGDEVVTCESCGRILYYSPPQSFEEDLNPAVPVNDPA